ncbi:MAG TPA: class I SAM-dependent methyltransferase [Pyrinomonadaceae bacterium]|nr:class I SAM-dependent methyltransferase [Pyrinomonadaceae bacterium]
MAKNDIATNEELLKLLDNLLEERSSEWWTKFYSDPHRKCPFFTENPDENLVELVENHEIIPPSKVLELGCGSGRNSNYLAGKGFEVEAVDFSETAIKIAGENSLKTSNAAKYYCQSIFDFDYSGKSYDFIYDSGCFHHIAPHRRPDFLSIILQALKPDGIFAMVCFAPGGGSDYSDREVYEKRSMGGGLSFSEESLNKIFSKQFQNIRIRKMKELPENSGLFGKDFLWTIRMEKSNKNTTKFF